MLELIFFIVFLLGFGFKMMHWPGSGLLLLIGLSFLAIIAFIESIRWKVKDSDQEKPHPLIRIFLGLSLMTACIGLLFRLLHWVGNSTILTIGSIALVLGVVLVVQKMKRGSRMYIRLLTFVLVIGFFRIVNEEQLLKWKYPNDPEFVRRMTEYYENPKNDSLRNHAYNYWHEKDQ